ncbi:MAG: tripartite tricarboxylate transporter TctB family protein [Rhodospirillales bacterium]|nr:tripartite tricarboxylate transporter TctB family protein [Rhodospirillales bacterium]
MASTDTEIVVEDPNAPSDDSPPVTSVRAVDVVVSLLLLTLALVLAVDNWRTGMSWDFAGPQAGYFPFYLSVILGGACIYGLVGAYRSRAETAQAFVTRDQLRRVLQVFVPTLLFCVFMQWLGLYVASFLLVGGFMWRIGRIVVWKSLLTSALFSLIMFATFEIAFNVIMPKGPVEALFGY